MRCIGRTKLFHRCKKDCKFILCWHHRFQWIPLIITLISVLASVISLWTGASRFLSTKSEHKNNSAEKLVNSYLEDSLPLVSVPPNYLMATPGACDDSILYKGVKVLEDNRVWDFRRSVWVNELQNNPFGSPVSFKRTVTFIRDSTCKKFVLRFSTGGSTIYVRCRNHKYEYCVPTKVIQWDPEKKQLMKSIDIIVDLKYDDPKDTMILIYEGTSYNGFLNKPDEGFGSSILGCPLPDKLTSLCYFSKLRSPKEVKLCGYKAYQKTCFPVSNISLAFSSDSLSFSWIVFSNSENSKLTGVDTKWKWK